MDSVLIATRVKTLQHIRSTRRRGGEGRGQQRNFSPPVAPPSRPSLCGSPTANDQLVYTQIHGEVCGAFAGGARLLLNNGCCDRGRHRSTPEKAPGSKDTSKGQNSPVISTARPGKKTLFNKPQPKKCTSRAKTADRSAGYPNHGDS